MKSVTSHRQKKYATLDTLTSFAGLTHFKFHKEWNLKICTCSRYSRNNFMFDLTCNGNERQWQHYHPSSVHIYPHVSDTYIYIYIYDHYVNRISSTIDSGHFIIVINAFIGKHTTILWITIILIIQPVIYPYNIIII